MDRRTFLHFLAGTFASQGISIGCGKSNTQSISLPVPQSDSIDVNGSFATGAAKACILLYMAGGPSQVDLFDPKPESLKVNGPKAIPLQLQRNCRNCKMVK